MKNLTLKSLKKNNSKIFSKSTLLLENNEI
nr:MAG TPA: hypothetical protein [Caudoviricetes sp.]